MYSADAYDLDDLGSGASDDGGRTALHQAADSAAESHVRIDQPRSQIRREAALWTDDPVRAYLSEIGRYPLLTRDQEIALAKAVELNRQAFRHELL